MCERDIDHVVNERREVPTSRDELRMEAQGFLSIDETAEDLRKTPAALGAMRTRGSGPLFMKIGRTILYRASDISDFLDRSMSDRAQGRR